MIHRQYVVKLPLPGEQYVGSCDIIVGLPGSRTSPVASQAVYPGATVTPPPAAWITQCADAAYYEVRGRSIPLDYEAGDPGFTPRGRLGGYLSVVNLQDPSGVSAQLNTAGIQVPQLTLSASLAPALGVSAAIWPAYTAALADPSYGPIIRVWNAVSLHTTSPGHEDPIYLVSIGFVEAKDEDFEASGLF